MTRVGLMEKCPGGSWSTVLNKKVWFLKDHPGHKSKNLLWRLLCTLHTVQAQACGMFLGRMDTLEWLVCGLPDIRHIFASFA